MTVFAILGSLMDFSGSYMWPKDLGAVWALFIEVLFSNEAIVRAHHDANDVDLLVRKNWYPHNGS